MYVDEFDENWTEDPTDPSYLVNRVRGAKTLILNLSDEKNVTSGSITIAEDLWFLDQTSFQFIFGIFLLYLSLITIKLCKSGFFKCRCLGKFSCCKNRRENYAEQEYRVLFVKMQFKNYRYVMLVISLVIMTFHLIDLLTDVSYITMVPMYNFPMLLALVFFMLPPVPLAMIAISEGGWAINPFVDFFLILTGTHGLIALLKIWDDPN